MAPAPNTPRVYKDWRLIGLMVAVVGLVVPWIWRAAQYPTRPEFNEVRADIRRVDKETTTKLHEIQTEQKVIKNEIRHIRESQRRIEVGLDRLLPRLTGSRHLGPSAAESN